MLEKIKRILKNYNEEPEGLETCECGLASANAHHNVITGMIGNLRMWLSHQDYFLVIVNGKILNPGFEARQENLLIYKDKIIGTSSNLPENLPENVCNINIIDADNLVITPGLVDQHIHGGYGCDFNYSSVEEIIEFSQKLPRHGITSILPTVMTASENVLKKQISNINTAKKFQPLNSTKLLGIHLEGPYLSPKYKGIHPKSEILVPSVENFKRIEDPEIKIVTYAPELDENFEFTKYLASKNIIPAAGHTDADSSEIRAAAGAGLRQITHMFNAMRPLNHRNPGVAGEALINDNLYVEVIADTLHLHPAIIDIILRTKPDSKIIFISDSLPLNQADADSIIFGGQKIFKENNKAVNSEGTLAGSLMFLDSALKNQANLAVSSFSDLLKFASLNVCTNLGRHDLGFIDAGKYADLVLWNMTNYRINMTIINGQIAFKA